MSSMVPAVSYPSVVGSVLGEVRRHAGKGQADLAVACGMTQSGWSRIERGQVPITVEQLALAARELDCRPSELLSAADRAVDVAREDGIEVQPNRLAAVVGTGLVVIGAAALTFYVGKAIAQRLEWAQDRDDAQA